MKSKMSILALSSFLLLGVISLSAYAAPVVSCSKSVIFYDKAGTLASKPINFKLSIEKDANGRYAASGIMKTKSFRSRDIFVQHLQPEQVRAMAEYTEAMSGVKTLKGVVTADTYDINSNPRLAVIVGKDKNKKIIEITFSTDEYGFGTCK